MRARVAWWAFAATVLLAVGQVIILTLSDTPLFSTETIDDGFPLITLGAVVASAVGALIVTRFPRHRIGWLFIIGQLGTMVGLTAQAYGFSAVRGDFGSRWSGQLALWVSIQAGGAFALALVAMLLLLAPDGHLLSRRWTWALALTVLGLVAHAVGVATIPPSELNAEAGSPIEQPLARALSTIALAALAVGLVAGAVSLLIRLRRATGDERAQLRWIVAAATGLALSLPLGLVLELVADPEPWLAVFPLMLAYLCLPVFTGIAILRFHLYDIDILLNRSIVLTLLTGFVATCYVALVVVFGELDDVSARSSFWRSMVATVVVALAFQPMRRRVNRFADRVVYGARAAPYEALARFSDELRFSSSTPEALPRLAEAAGRAVGARSSEVWVDVPGEEPSAAQWPEKSPAVRDLVLPVADEAGPLGGLAVSMPPGRQLRPADRRLLADFATQLAKAFRSARLEDELAAQVQLLAARAVELRRSSRRLVSAQAVARARFESAIDRQVLPYLRTMPDELRGLQEGGGPWPLSQVEQMVDRVDQALESLRALTRGVFPAQLAHRGLAAALAAHTQSAANGGVVRLVESIGDRRYDPSIESGAYFCTVELIATMPGPTEVVVGEDAELLRISVSGDGSSSDLEEHVRDRAEALGGVVRVEEWQSRTRASIELPVGSAADVPPRAPQQLGAKG